MFEEVSKKAERRTMRRNTNTIYSLAFAIALFLPACGGEKRDLAERDNDREELPVGIETVELQEMETILSAVGTVRSKTTADIASRVMGYVTAVNVREGTRVRKGQILSQIDSRESEAQLDRARAGLSEAESAAEEVDRMIRATESALEAARANARLAESTHGRFKELLSRKSVSQQEFDEVEAKYRAANAEVKRTEEMLHSAAARKQQVQARIDQAKAQLASAELHRGYSKVISPMNGLVTSKQVELGQLASPGSVLFTIEDDRNYRLEATVEESRIRYVSAGIGMMVHVDALGVDLEGRVAEIVPAADPGSRSFTVKIDLPQHPMLRSGLFGRARFAGATTRTLTLPADSVVQRGQLAGVYVVNAEQKVDFRLVKTGRLMNQRVEILSGLKQGDQVVVTPLDKVEEGSRVRILDTTTRLFPTGSQPPGKEGDDA